MNRPINLLFLFAMLLISCNSKTNISEGQPILENTTIRYRLTYDTADKYPGYPNGRYFRYEVDKKYSSEELNSIADSIIRSDNGHHAMISIHWAYIEDYENPDAWKSDLFACSMTRDGKVVTTTEQEMKDRLAEQSGDERKTTTIGIWRDNVTNCSLYIVKDDDSTYYLQVYYTFFDPLEVPLKRENLDGKIIYTIPGHEGGFMNIDNEGVLRIYDSNTMKNIISFGK